MGINNSQRAGFAEELLGTVALGTLSLGPLLFNPVIIIFDNFGTNAAEVSIDGGTTTWKTFPAGEALVLDLRAAHGLAANYTFDIGTTFTISGTNGDQFSISYIYAYNP